MKYFKYIIILLIFIGLVAMVFLFFLQKSGQPEIKEVLPVIAEVPSSTPKYSISIEEEKLGPANREKLLELTVPVVLHPVRASGVLSTQRSDKEIVELLEKSQHIWQQADIKFNFIVQEIVLNKFTQERITSGFHRILYDVLDSTDNKIHIFFVNSIDGINAIAYSPQVALVADTTTVPAWRSMAHEIGHLFNLEHVLDDRDFLMYQGVVGTLISAEEIQAVRQQIKDRYSY